MKRIHLLKRGPPRKYNYPYKAISITGPIPEIDAIRTYMKKHRISYKLALYLFMNIWTNLEQYERTNQKKKIKAQLYRDGKYKAPDEIVPLLLKRDGQIIAKFTDPWLLIPYIDYEIQSYLTGKHTNDYKALFHQEPELKEIKDKLKDIKVRPAPRNPGKKGRKIPPN